MSQVLTTVLIKYLENFKQELGTQCSWASASFLHLMWSKSNQAQHKAVQAAILIPGLSPALPKVSDARLSPMPAGEPMHLITFSASWATSAISSHKLSAHQRLIGQSRTSHSASYQADHSANPAAWKANIFQFSLRSSPVHLNLDWA